MQAYYFVAAKQEFLYIRECLDALHAITWINNCLLLPEDYCKIV